MKNTILIFSLISVATVLIFSCSTDNNAKLAERDLLEYGMPITIKMPDSAEVKTMDWGVQKDVTIEGENDFSIQIFSSQTSSQNLESALREIKEVVQTGPYFSKYILEESDGFIFEMTVDTIANYDFRHLKIQGDNEYLFQAGLASKLGQVQIEKLYQIAKEAK